VVRLYPAMVADGKHEKSYRSLEHSTSSPHPQSDYSPWLRLTPFRAGGSNPARMRRWNAGDRRSTGFVLDVIYLELNTVSSNSNLRASRKSKFLGAGDSDSHVQPWSSGAVQPTFALQQNRFLRNRGEVLESCFVRE